MTKTNSEFLRGMPKTMEHVDLQSGGRRPSTSETRTRCMQGFPGIACTHPYVPDIPPSGDVEISLLYTKYKKSCCAFSWRNLQEVHSIRLLSIFVSSQRRNVVGETSRRSTTVLILLQVKSRHGGSIMCLQPLHDGERRREVVDSKG